MPVTFYTGTPTGGVWPTSLSVANQQLTVSLTNTSISTTLPAWKCVNSQVQSGGCSGKNPCTYTYYRTVSFLSVANMQVQLPDSCGSGPCAPSQLIATGCSLVYVPSPPISSAWRGAWADAACTQADARLRRSQSRRRSTMRTETRAQAWAR